MEVLNDVISWGSPLGLALFFIGIGIFFWGFSHFLRSVIKKDKEEES